MKNLLSALVLAILVCIPAKGEEVVFAFRGTVHELDGEFSYFSGQPFEIAYSFENKTADANPGDPESGAYIGAIKSATLTLYNGREYFRWTLKPDGYDNSITIKNLGAEDSYIAGGRLTGPVYDNEISAFFLIELIDKDAAVFSDDKLPSSLKIDSFDRIRAQLTLIGVRKYTYSTLGVITSGNAPVRKQ